MKNSSQQVRILRSKLFCRDESIRNKGFCAETGKIGITGTASETGKPGKIGEIAKAPVSRRFALFHILLNPPPNSSPTITISSQVWLNPPNSTASTNNSGQNQNRPSPKKNFVAPHASRIPMLITLAKSTAIKTKILSVNIVLSSLLTINKKDFYQSSCPDKSLAVSLDTDAFSRIVLTISRSAFNCLSATPFY